MCENVLMSSGQVFDVDGTFPGDESWRPGEYAGAAFSGISLLCNFEAATFENALVTDCSVRENVFLQCDLSGVQFLKCRFENVDFTDDELGGSRWPGSVIENTDFIGCFFSQSSFAHASLRSVSFAVCEFDHTSFASATLEDVRFDECKFRSVNIDRTAFHDCDMKPFVANHQQLVNVKPVLDWRSLCRSLRVPGLTEFLVNAGMPEVIALYSVDAARAVDPLLLFRVMQSTFISYGHPDVRFARQLRERLFKNGVRRFFFELDATPGERLHRVMRGRINEYDRVILICSSSSLTRPAVRNEIEETLAREARDGGATYLIPVVIDEFLFEWDDQLAVPLRDRVVADFRRTARNSRLFDTAFLRLLRALTPPERTVSGA